MLLISYFDAGKFWSIFVLAILKTNPFSQHLSKFNFIQNLDFQRLFVYLCTGNPGSVIVPQYGSSCMGKNNDPIFLGNTKYKSMKLILQLSLSLLLQRSFFFHEIRTPTENKHARIVVIGYPQIQKPMKLSQIEKRIPQTLTYPKDVIQNGREYARRSSQARSKRGQENKAWALYKKNPSGVFWVDLSRDRYTPAGNTSGRGLLFT